MFSDFTLFPRQERHSSSDLNERASRRRRILLADRVMGDCPVTGSGANAQTFLRMWSAACAENDADIIIKSHPDVAADRAKGFLTSYAEGRVHFIGNSVSSHSVVDEVRTVSSRLGLDALLRGIPVVTPGVSTYAAWDLTPERAGGATATAAPARHRYRVDIDEFTSTLFRPRHRSNVAGLPCGTEDLMTELYRARQGDAAKRPKGPRLTQVVKSGRLQ